MDSDKLAALDAEVQERLTAPDNPRRWFDDHRFLAADLGAHIREVGLLVLDRKGELYRYENGVYINDGDTWARKATARALDGRYAKRYVEEVVSYLRLGEVFIPEQPEERWINTTNGLLCWEEGQLHPHGADVPTTIQIPHRWNPEATCPNCLQFLEEILPPGAIDLIFELMGYSLYVGNPFANAVLLVGPGGNGKSVLLRLVTALVGQVNASSVPLQALSENRFAAGLLYGRLVNVCGDLDARAVTRTDTFKQVTGGDEVMADRKFREPFVFRNRAMMWFAGNEEPFSSDQSAAWFQRWIVIPMAGAFRGTNATIPISTAAFSPRRSSKAYSSSRLLDYSDS
jgi:putative DNA primase/helicase